MIGCHGWRAGGDSQMDELALHQPGIPCCSCPGGTYVGYHGRLVFTDKQPVHAELVAAKNLTCLLSLYRGENETA